MILLVCHGRGDAVPERVRDTHQRRATPQRRHTKVRLSRIFPTSHKYVFFSGRHSTTTHVLHEPQRTHSAPHPAALTNGDMLDSSDAEVAQIEFQSSGRVNLRTKKNDVPRPMSWEGELSDGERDMCIDEDHGSQVKHNLNSQVDVLLLVVF